MEIEKIKITDIKPAEYNPRQITSEELTKLTNSINEFGLVDPIIINLKNNKIIGGHQRYDVLINQYMLDNNFYAELNLIRMGDIGWIFTETDLKVEDEDHEKALNLALNKISGEWDFEKLGEILDELTINNFNIELTGFDELEIELNNYDIDNDYTETEYTLDDDGEDHTNNLSKKYIVPPFSVLDTKTKKWQDRKREWLKLTDNLSETRTGEYGEIGGGGGLLHSINEGTSNFDPVLAEIIIKWFSKQNTIILDPFGGEQTKGIVAGELGYEYHAVEIREDQVKLNTEKTSKYNNINYYCGDSNNIKHIVPIKEYDLCFTSPPYYDLEIYSAEDMSSLGTYEKFMEQYKNIFQQCYDLLTDNSFLIVKIGEIRNKKTGEYRGFVSDNINILTEIGFKYYNEIILLNTIGTAPIRANNNMKTRKIVKIHQNVLVFYKGELDNIKENYPIIEFEEEQIYDE